MWLHNTLSRKAEELHPLESGVVRMYSCGPTVYRYAHIGNLRTYLMADWIRRTLENQNLQVIHVKNITDVGHMRQERLEDEEDKIISSALSEGITPQEIAGFYTRAFHEDEEKIGILPATYFPRATENIDEMIRITQALERRGYTYEVRGNVYFAVSQCPDYGKLSGNAGANLLEGVRSEVDDMKLDQRDFTLWKAAEPGRTLKWPSPWGDGFPGWHIECSAMSTKYLGEQLDIHTGGVDNVFPHHEGELAQSECAFGKPFVQMWVHGEHLLADGIKMSKSAGNDYTLEDLETKGFDPMAYRYLCLTVRHGKRLNFTFSSLAAAQRGLQRLRNRVWKWSMIASTIHNSADTQEWREAFWNRINDNLNMPSALALTWSMIHSDMPAKDRLELLLEFDNVLGLNLQGVTSEWNIPEHIVNAEKRRSILRSQKNYSMADKERQYIKDQGFILDDGVNDTTIRPKSTFEKRQDLWMEISSSKEVSSMLSTPDSLKFSVGIVACNYIQDVQRCISGLQRLIDSHSMEIMVVDNGSTDGTSVWLETQAKHDSRIRVIHTDHVLGEAAAKNILLKQSLGTYVVLMDTSIEATGDFLTTLADKLSDESIGVTGPWGLRTQDLRHFEEIDYGRAHAVQAYCFAFRRSLISEVDLIRESFRFYRNLDLEYSFCFLDKGYSIVSVSSLPLLRHEHRAWSKLAKDERDNLSQSNFRRFLKRWGHRQDLLEETNIERQKEIKQVDDS